MHYLSGWLSGGLKHHHHLFRFIFGISGYNLKIQRLLKRVSIMKKLIRAVEPEAILWVLALLALVFIDPYGSNHFSFCIFRNLGFESCPGCGLGRAIALIYRGEPAASFEAHPLGIITFAFIVGRIIKLLFRSFYRFKYNSGGRYGRCISADARSARG